MTITVTHITATTTVTTDGNGFHSHTLSSYSTNLKVTVEAVTLVAEKLKKAQFKSLSVTEHFYKDFNT
jgi:hypothetical protein